MSVTASPEPPFGRMLTAMVTPMADDGALDLVEAARLATHLVDAGNEGLIISGTTGEAPTTDDSEKDALLRVVVEAVGNRCHVVAGVGTNDTAHTVTLARRAEKAGAGGLLVVTPYYSNPPQSGLRTHFQRVASATDLPVMLYDIPRRSGVPITAETLVALSGHPQIVAVKDAKGDVAATSQVLARTDLAFYSGDDITTLPLLAVGGVGVVSVVAHLATGLVREMVEAYLAGDVARARSLHLRLLPAFTGMFRTQGAILCKAGLRLAGRPAGPVRSPLPDATEDEVRVLRADLASAGLLGEGDSA